MRGKRGEEVKRKRTKKKEEREKQTPIKCSTHKAVDTPAWPVGESQRSGSTCTRASASAASDSHRPPPSSRNSLQDAP